MDSSSILGSGSSSTFGNCATSDSSHTHSSGCPSVEMVFLLENQVSFLREQMSVLIVEMGMTHQWIRNNFGAQIQIINTESSYYKILHGHGSSLEMMEEIQKSLEVTTVTDDEATIRGTSNAEESTSTPTITTDGEENNGQARKEEASTATVTKAKQVKGTTKAKTGHGQSTTPAKAVIVTRKQTSSVASTSRNTSRRIPQSAAGVKQLFQCRHCLLHISHQSALIKHERTHITGGGKKPFQCRYCDDTFHQKAQQIRHERRRHTGEKPFKCEVTDCAKTFARMGDQKSHEQSHTTGDKPFACQYCDKKFARSANLSFHIRTHTGEKPIVCQHQDCGAAFHYAGALQEHRRKSHPTSNPTDQHSSLIV